MYNKRFIIPGLAVFVLFVTFPLWFNAFSTAASTVPKPELPPGGEKQCVAPLAEMRANHMGILNEWRADVRNGVRVAITIDGKEYRNGLQTGCIKCHSNKEKFCDSCHEYTSAKPNCWNCHLSPAVAATKKETL